MTRMPQELLELLAPVVEAARSVLADMETTDVPVKLRKVAQSSARTLPPPLARSLLAVIEEDEPFRQQVADALESDDPAIAAYVGRPAGWWITVAGALADRSSADARRREGDARAEIERLGRFAAEAEARVREARAETDAARADAGARVEQARARVRELAEADRGGVERMAAVADELRAELVEARSALEETNAVAASLRVRLRRMRRSRPNHERGPRESMPQDPAELARSLDSQFELAASATIGAPSPSTRRQQPGIALPAGVAPDSPDALGWLLAAPASTVIVDGYNVLFRVEPAGSLTGAARRRLEETLRRLHRQSASHHSIVVVYDSSLTGERVPEASRGGVRTRFAESDRLADEEIVELAKSATGPTVVITSDREVRDAVRSTGAVALWSEVLMPLFG